MPLSIGFVLDDGLDKPDGVQQNILTLGEWLAKKGHRVTYIVGQTDRQDIKNIKPISKNLKVRFNDNALSVPLYSSRQKIKKVLSGGNFDVLHVQVPYSPLMAGRLIKMADNKTAVVGTFHILPSNFLSEKGTKVLSFWLRRNLKLFDKQLAVSAPAKDFALKSFGIDCDILPNPLDLSKFAPNTSSLKLPSKAIKIVFLGRLVNRKGCQHLINAINKLENDFKQNQDYHVDIYGDGQLKSGLKHHVKRYGLQKKISFHGFISENDKASMLRTADICVFPSVSGESFGIVLIEAMAAGKPVILAGDNPGYRSILGSLPGSLFNPKDAAGLAARLNTLINDEKMRQKLFSAQQKLVGQYDVNLVGRKLLAIYNDCITAKNSR